MFVVLQRYNHSVQSSYEKHNTERDKGTNCTSETEGGALRRPCVAGLMALQTSQKQLTSLTKDSANALRVHATEVSHGCDVIESLNTFVTDVTLCQQAHQVPS